MLELDGEDLRDRPLEERKAKPADLSGVRWHPARRAHRGARRPSVRARPQARLRGDREQAARFVVPVWPVPTPRDLNSPVCPGRRPRETSKREVPLQSDEIGDVITPAGVIAMIEVLIEQEQSGIAFRPEGGPSRCLLRRAGPTQAIGEINGSGLSDFYHTSACCSVKGSLS